MKKKINLQRINQSGQFEPFKLLIGAVLGLLILILVLGVVESVRSVQWQLSEGRFYDGFKIALNTPTGDEVLREKLLFRKGTVFSGIGLGHNTPVGPLCITFTSYDDRISTLNNNSIRKAEILFDLQTDVIFICRTMAPDPPNCPGTIQCSVTFGSP
ncbi:MAG: hypothetical protein V1777_04630 [Candidatus Micrarchaeota archaeon]